MYKPGLILRLKKSSMLQKKKIIFIRSTLSGLQCDVNYRFHIFLGYFYSKIITFKILIDL